MSLKYADTNSFSREVLQNPQPVLVDFYAEWCPPCRMMEETVSTIAGQLDGTADVVKVNVDQAQEIAAEYGIQSIPAFVMFKQGHFVGRLTGVVPAQQLLNLVHS